MKITALSHQDSALAKGWSGDPASDAVARAEALILTQPDEPYSAESLARAVGVSPRSLFRGFHRLRGCGPMEAVRRARLLRVRIDLLNAGSHERVTDAAMRWGFFHLGRFANVYSDYFGELPSETRRRSRLAGEQRLAS